MQYDVEAFDFYWVGKLIIALKFRSEVDALLKLKNLQTLLDLEIFF